MPNRPQRERPSQFDGTQFVIFVDLPRRPWTTGELYEYVYGVRLDDGAKPWPYFRESGTEDWWSLSTPGDHAVDALAWMIDLDQLTYKGREAARAFLEGVLPELETRAARFGGAAVPETSIPDALTRMVAVQEMLRVRDYEVTIVVAAPDGPGYRVAEWWQALEAVGLKWGDGDLFWLYNGAFAEDEDQPYELFCAEPHSVLGYFHSGDLNGPVRFPDVALHFRAKDIPDAPALLRRMAEVASQVASRLGAVLRTSSGHPFELDASEAELGQALRRLRELQHA